MLEEGIDLLDADSVQSLDQHFPGAGTQTDENM